MPIDVQHLCSNCFQKRISQGGPCPVCGYLPVVDKEKYPMALPKGSILNGNYIIGRVLGQGGFGITYLAWDHSLKIRVAVKEYFPEGVVTRLYKTTLVSPVSQDAQESFTYGLQCFLEEAKVLGKLLGSPGIVGVHSFFEENGTAYFTMDYVEGISFQHYIKAHGGRISWQETAGVLLPVINALCIVHRTGIYHRDVTPDNILLDQNGTVKLIDFGSARQTFGHNDRSMDVLLKAGYAPKEQYARNGRQGAYTDVYSLAACFYASITGYLPPESLKRVDCDKLIPPSKRGVLIPAELESAILRGLSVYQQDRFQTMEEFRAALAPLHPEQYSKLCFPVKISPALDISSHSLLPMPQIDNISDKSDEIQIEPAAGPQMGINKYKMWLTVCAGIAAAFVVTAILFFLRVNQI